MKYKITWLICLLIIVWCGKTDAQPDTLERLRTKDWDVWLGDGGYDLALMGDEAAPFLVQVLTDENEEARWHAHYFLDRFYADTRVLPSLTKLFLNNENSDVRRDAAGLIASVDVVYAQKLMIQYLNDVERQDIAENVLANFGDERVIPMLIAKFNDPKVDPNIRRYIASTLADFRHKSAVPVLLEILDDPKTQRWTRDEVVEKLANIGDERALPALLNLLNKDSILSRKIIKGLSQSGPSIVQPLLKKIEQLDTTKSSYMKHAIFEIFGNQKDPEFIPIYEKVILETDDSKLQSAMAGALGNMGEAGFESLLKIVRKKPNSMVLRTLATYNSAAAIDAVTSLAFDKSFPLRKEAIQAFVRYGGLWKAEVSKHIAKLLADVNPKEKLLIIKTLPQLGDLWKAEIYKHMLLLLSDTDLEVRLLTIDLIQQMKLTTMAPALKKLTQDAKGSTRNAAHMVYDIFLDKPQLKLEIEMNQPRYDYGEIISLTYRIENVSDHPIKIALYKTLVSSFLKLEIQQPDGTFAKYTGPRARLRPLTLNDYQTLQPDDKINGTIPVSKYYNLHQPGLYIVQLHVSPVRGGVILPPSVPPNDKKIPLGRNVKSSFMTWSDTLISPRVHFNIEPPPADKLNKMIASIDPKLVTQANAKEITKTCGLLGELRKPEAIPALKKLALINFEDRDHPHQMVQAMAEEALLKFSDSGLLQTWIEILNRKGRNPVAGYSEYVKALGASGDARAIEPLRQIAFHPGNYSFPEKAALALKQLRDNTAVAWFTKVAYRKLRHWKKDEREKGIRILNNLHPRKERITTRLHNLRNPRFYAENYDLYLNWAVIREKAGTVSGLKELLQHTNPIIQRSAAYELAYRGDRSGAHYIKKDLHANDSSTRMHARDTLVKLQSE